MRALEDRFEELDLAHSTRATYRSRLNRLGAPTAPTAPAIRDWVRSKTAGRPRGTALPTRAAALHYLVAELGLTEAQAKDLLPRLGRGRDARVRMAPQDAEYARFDRAVRGLEPGPVRTLLLLLPLTGLRISEACGLHADDWLADSAPGFLRVRGKGRVLRLVPLDPEASALLRPHVGPRTEWIFPGRSGEVPLTKWAVYAVLRKMAARDPHFPAITPHKLRHWFAIQALAAGVDLLALKTLMGHKSVTTTEIYAQHDSRTLVAAIGKMAAHRKQRGRQVGSYKPVR